MEATQSTEAARRFSCANIPFDDAPDRFGELEDSAPLLGDARALRERMLETGYLLLRGLLDRAEVMDARREVTRRLAAQDLLVPGTDPMDAIGLPEEALSRLKVEIRRDEKGYDRYGQPVTGEQHAAFKRLRSMPEVLAADNAPLMKVLYGGPMISFFESFLGEPVRHYDFTWFRSIFPGSIGTYPHADVVYMGRGERERLYTAWTPMGDIDYEQGGLVILEGSNHHERLHKTYFERDVDAHCANREDKRDEWAKGLNGILATDARRVREGLGGRWLTGEFRAGDLLVFSTYTVHCSLDNRSDRVRLSSDSRYQPASTPADERWIGPNPVGHGVGGKRENIC
jgi:hypothetical protein